MKHVGIVACSAEGAALCYRTICTEAPRILGEHTHPEVSMHTIGLARYMHHIYRSDWNGVADLMLASAQKLAAIGADFAICPDNTIHQTLPLVESRSPIPWLHIAEVVADEAARRHFRCVGLTGTRWLVESAVYPDALNARGIEYARPKPDVRRELNRIIMDELVNAIFTSHSIAYVQTAIAELQSDGCDAVVLGCTELPLIVNDDNAALPTLDSTRLLARAALQRAIEQA